MQKCGESLAAMKSESVPDSDQLSILQWPMGSAYSSTWIEEGLIFPYLKLVSPRVALNWLYCVLTHAIRI